MTDDRPRARSIISAFATAVVLFAAFVLVFGGIFLWARSAERSENPNITHTPKPTVYISYGENTHAEVLPTHEISTPAPDFSATQRALDATVQAHEAAVATQMAEAANIVTATALAHQGRIYEAEYNGAVAVLSSKMQALEFEQDLHTETISHTVRMNAVEESERQRYLIWRDNIVLFAMGGAVLVGALVAGILVVRFGLNMLVPESEEYEPERVRLEMVTADKKHTIFGMLPVSDSMFRVWAECASKEQSIAYDYWTGKDKPFTRKEYDALMEIMRDMGVVVYRDPDKPNLGQRVPAKWRAELRGYVERAES